MAFSYKTPGVYLEEIVKLPPSVASVETAIPCFFGVTQKATEVKDGDLTGMSYKIGSLADYELYYGMPDVVKAQVTVKLNLPAEAQLSANYLNVMYYAVKHYFDNGGGPCYIHSIGAYARTGIDVNTYKAELLKLDLVDEVTLIVFPDLWALTNKDQYYDVYNAALQKVASLQDKFVIIDVNRELTSNKVSPVKSKTEFRNTISNNIDSIKYGAAYFPHLVTTYTYDFNSASITMTFAADVLAANAATNLLNTLDYKSAKDMFTVNSVVAAFNDEYFKNISVEAYASKISDINSRKNSVLSYYSTADQQSLTDKTKLVTDLIKTQADAAIAAAKTKFDLIETAAKEKTNLLTQLQDKVKALFGALPAPVIAQLKAAPKNVDDTDYAKLNTTFLSKINPFFNSIFEARLKEAFNNIPLLLPASPAMAGVYAAVDRTRGVWKAPANVSLNAVAKPEVLLSDLDQEDFNVDAENGKSINCIREFVGRGKLVWGARTLAGNNNEWRYINVRRFFNMVEESCQNAARQFVFEPNDANTWIRVKGMIDNYLTVLWRDGALQGAKPEHAFYTAVGLNQTMTADDVLNGLLIVEIGLAVVRPAEFIVLRFSHKMATS
ncbi:phage tail sheath family protein [Paraflavitalea pollutisoli]|uniref:phage tail sheath family protein n=1 Tax=Paraflavitalea pollutisoli TaxID=3034143 RepID=UPI0023ED67B2|nr:phage tail sheath C-terminal domain-containing protein [Paraflavitalea sp. H1-2-19X]